MADSELDPKVLLNRLWRELRTEVREWEDEECVGYDCLTRYWCQDAVFEVYWIAECDVDCLDNESYSVYLTEDLQLESFKCQFAYQPDLDWKRALAVKLDWQQRAKSIIRDLAANQTDRF